MQFQKGHTINLGRKMSISRIGQGKGRKLSPEHIQAMKDGLKGRTAWNKGKKGTLKHTQEYKDKMSELMSGERNPNFGKTGKNHPKWTEDKKHPFHKAVRSLHEYKKWRTDIFKRDNFTCADCGESKIYIEADHHPERFIDIIRKNEIDSIEKAVKCEELWDIENGRTLCKKCHKEKHSL